MLSISENGCTYVWVKKKKEDTMFPLVHLFVSKMMIDKISIVFEFSPFFILSINVNNVSMCISFSKYLNDEDKKKIVMIETYTIPFNSNKSIINYVEAFRTYWWRVYMCVHVYVCVCVGMFKVKPTWKINLAPLWKLRYIRL